MHHLDLSAAFCDARTCRALRDGTVVFRDGNHITGAFSAALAPVLAAEIAPLIPAERR